MTNITLFCGHLSRLFRNRKYSRFTKDLLKLYRMFREIAHQTNFNAFGTRHAFALNWWNEFFPWEDSFLHQTKLI